MLRIFSRITVLFSVIFLGIAFTSFFCLNLIIESERESIEYFIKNSLSLDVSYRKASIKFLPKLALSLENLVIENPENQKKPFATADSAGIKIDLLALFVGQVLVDELSLDHAVIMHKRSEKESAGQALSFGFLDSVISRIKGFKVSNSKLILEEKGAKPKVIEQINFLAEVSADYGLIGFKSFELEFEYLQNKYKTAASNAKLEVRSNKLALGELRLEFDGSELKLNDLILENSEIQHFVIKTKDFDLSSFPKLAALFAPVSNKLRSQKGFLSTELTAKRNKNTDFFLKGQFELRDYEIQNAKDYYKISLVSGPIELLIVKEADTKISSSALKIINFAFSDEQTRLENVDLIANNLKANINQNTDVTVSADLKGQRLNLEAPSVQIFSIDSLTGPLTIKVPSSGGYLVEGPARLEGGKLAIFNKTLDQTSADVDLYISKEKKSFKSTNTNYLFANNMQSLSAKFQMTPSIYEIIDGSIVQGNGRFNLDAQMMRKTKDDFSFSLRVSDFDFRSMLSFFVKEKDAAEYTGILELLVASAQGRRSAFLESLNADGKFIFRQGIIRNLNLSEKVIKVLEQVKFINPMRKPKVDDDEREQELESSFRVSEQKVFFEKLKITRNWYTIKGKGELSFDLALDIRARIVILRETFKSLGLGIKPIEMLFEELGAIEIPVVIDGKLPKIDVAPDLKEMAKRYSGISLLEYLWKGVRDVVR